MKINLLRKDTKIVAFEKKETEDCCFTFWRVKKKSRYEIETIFLVFYTPKNKTHKVKQIYDFFLIVKIICTNN